MSISAEMTDTALSGAGVPGELPLDLPDPLWDLLPIAIYVCDRGGSIVSYNRRAGDLWGRAPKLRDSNERFCGSYRLYRFDGGLLPHAQCPMADVLRTGIPVRDQEVVIERPDGTRVAAMVSIDPLKDRVGRIVGAVNCFQDITERKHLDAELRRSREELADFFEHAAVAMNWVGPDGIILRANQAELDLLGYQREEYVGLHVGQFHAEPASIDDILARLSRGETLDKYPARLRAKDGTIRHVQISSNVQFRDGEFVHTRCVTVDVTKQINLETALRESERRFRDLLGALPAAIYTTDADGRITYYNQAAIDLSGREPKLGTDEWCVTWKLYHPDGTPMPHDQCPMAIALKENRPVRGAEALAERPDGTRIPFIPYPTPLHDESGRLIGAVNMLVDLTDRKQAERYALRLASIVESSDDAIISKDLNGVIVSWNAGAERLFGYAAEEAIGMPVINLIPPDRLDEEPNILERIHSGERVHPYETLRRRKDGSVVDVLLTVSPVKDVEGKIIGASKIVRDISERKRALEQQQLILLEMKHRIRNLLATVQAIAMQTLPSTSDKERDAFIARLQALASAQDLLTLKRWQRTPLNSVVDQALAPFREKHRDRILIHSPDEIWLDTNKSLMLTLVLHELATNAVKHGALSNGSGQVRIEWEHQEQASRAKLLWKESGGPPVKQPNRRGFGSRLLGNTMRGDLSVAKLDYNPLGLICTVEIALDDERLS